MTQILVIADLDFKPDITRMKEMLNEDVTLNSVSQDGISIFECGETVPENIWDFTVLVGNCLQEMEFTIDVEIPLNEDPFGNLISVLSTAKEGMDTDEAIGEE